MRSADAWPGPNLTCLPMLKAASSTVQPSTLSDPYCCNCWIAVG
jgi:hypothetical protein